LEEKLFPSKPTTLFVDSIFMPVRKVNYKIKLIHDSYGTIKESLYLEILTNGSITPKRSLLEAIKVLMNLFYPVLLTSNFSSISSIFSQKINDLFEITKKKKEQNNEISEEKKTKPQKEKRIEKEKKEILSSSEKTDKKSKNQEKEEKKNGTKPKKEVKNKDTKQKKRRGSKKEEEKKN
jgi:DNA-directed RNA polymerase alpha subunit